MGQELVLIYKHFVRFGLKMHVGRAGAQSKMECVSPPPTSSIPSSPSPLQTVLKAVMMTMHSPMATMHSLTTTANVRTLCGSGGRRRKCSTKCLKKLSQLISRMAVSPFANTSSILAPTFPLVWPMIMTLSRDSPQQPNSWVHWKVCGTACTWRFGANVSCSMQSPWTYFFETSRHGLYQSHYSTSWKCFSTGKSTGSYECWWQESKRNAFEMSTFGVCSMTYLEHAMWLLRIKWISLEM